ncbi:MAG: aminotransferase class V-fold PLP-dependent enzyme [Candidatus Nanopelagicales bacterium]
MSVPHLHRACSDHPVVDRPGSLSRARLRGDTPGCERVAHLNNAGASLPPAPVVARMVAHLRLEEEIGGYEAARRVAEERAEGRAMLAALIGARPHQVALVESATAGLHRVLSTLSLHRGDRVLVAGSEYASTVLPLLQLSRRIGLRIEFVPDGPDGAVDPTALARMLDDDVRLVGIVHAPSHNGLVNDIGEVGRVLAGSRAWFLVDACQSLGQLPLDMSAVGCDFLVASGRKFLRGPRGSGLLAVSDRALSELDAYPVDLHGATWVHTDDFTLDHTAERFESFERSIAVELGLLAAARYASELSIPVLASAIGRHAEYLRCRAGAMGGWRVLDRGSQRSGIVALRHDRLPAAAGVSALAAAGINAWEVGSPSNPRELGERSVLRLSPHAFNTQEELDRALGVLDDL